MWRAVLLLATLAALHANPLEPHFRSDYVYNGRQMAFFKIHDLPRTWAAYYALCRAEGAELAYPETQDEANLMVTIMNENLSKKISGIWTGGHDKFAKGIYVNLDGQDISKLYSNWNNGEPNDSNLIEDCIAMVRDGGLNDIHCHARLPAICRKKLVTLTSNPACETADLAYVPGFNNQTCYKVHTQAKNWSDAYQTCHAEQSYLTIINGQKEADFLVKLMQQYPADNFKGNFHKGYLGVGFHDLYLDGEYLTIYGQKLQQAGYEVWQAGQPDNAGNNEHCGSIARDATLNDLPCSLKTMFICKRDVGNPNIVDMYSRFKDTMVLERAV